MSLTIDDRKFAIALANSGLTIGEAAKRAGIKEIILCRENKKDIDEIKKEYVKGIKFHFVDHIREVLDIALI